MPPGRYSNIVAGVVLVDHCVGSSIAAVDVVGKLGVVRGELAMELRSHSHYRFHIVAVLVVARHSALEVVDGSPH